MEHRNESRGIIHLIDHAIDAGPKAVGTLGADDLTHAWGTRGVPELGDSFEAALAGSVRPELVEVALATVQANLAVDARDADGERNGSCLPCFFEDVRGRRRGGR